MMINNQKYIKNNYNASQQQHTVHDVQNCSEYFSMQGEHRSHALKIYQRIDTDCSQDSQQHITSQFKPKKNQTRNHNTNKKFNCYDEWDQNQTGVSKILSNREKSFEMTPEKKVSNRRYFQNVKIKSNNEDQFPQNLEIESETQLYSGSILSRGNKLKRTKHFIGRSTMIQNQKQLNTKKNCIRQFSSSIGQNIQRRKIGKIGAGMTIVRKSLRQLDQGFLQEFKFSKQFLEKFFSIDKLCSNSSGNVLNPDSKLGRRVGNKECLYEFGTMLFNLHPLKGLSFVIASGLIRKDAGTIAGFLYENSSLSSQYIGTILSLMQNSDANSIFTLFSIKFEQFKGKQILDALKSFLSKIKIKNSIPIIDHLCHMFSKAYYLHNHLNPKFLQLFPTSTSVHSLAFSIIILGFELEAAQTKTLFSSQKCSPSKNSPASPHKQKNFHESPKLKSASANKQQQLKQRVQFLMSCKGMKDGQDFDQKYLNKIFDDVVYSNPLNVWKTSHQESVQRFRISQNVYGRQYTKIQAKLVLLNKLESDFDVDIIILPLCDLLIIKQDYHVTPLMLLTISSLKMIFQKKKKMCIFKSQEGSKDQNCLNFIPMKSRCLEQYQQICSEIEENSVKSQDCGIMKRRISYHLFNSKKEFVNTYSSKVDKSQNNDKLEELEQEVNCISFGNFQNIEEMQFEMNEFYLNAFLSECNKFRSMKSHHQ